MFSSSRRAILSSTAFKANSSSYSKYCLRNNAAGSIGDSIKPDKDSGAFRDSSGGDYDLDSNSSISNDSRK